MEIEMYVEGIGIDQGSRTLVLLRDSERKRFLPIWIGPSEAVSIAMQIESKQPPRPMTHDLMNNVLQALGVHVQKICVSDFRDSTFYATLTLLEGESVREIDARPSDAIALALRADATIFVDEKVLEEAAITIQEGEDAPEQSKEEIDQFMRLIEGVDIEKHFGES